MKHGTIKVGVIGWPVDHSLSPLLHGFWLQKYAISGTYQAIAVTPHALPEMLQNLAADGFAGLNVTVPHKQAVLAQLDQITDQAKRLGAVNTIVVVDHRLQGSNTDGFGFLENLKSGQPGFTCAAGPAVVLGAGGAARAIVATLIEQGAPSIRLVNRTLKRAEKLAADLAGPIQVVDWSKRHQALEGASLLVNTTTLGMAGKPPLELSLQALPANAVVNDIVYVPLNTPLLLAARERGNVVVDGLGMLLHQGRPGFAAWFGVEPEVSDDLRRHILAGLGE